MNGPGPVPPYPPAQSKATAITLRVIFLTITAISCGFLSGLPLLHLAIQRRRTMDWVFFWICTAVSIASFATVGTLPEESPWTDVAMLTAIALVPLVGVHYLVADLALHRAAAVPGYPSYATTVPYPRRTSRRRRNRRWTTTPTARPRPRPPRRRPVPPQSPAPRTRTRRGSTRCGPNWTS